MIRSPWFEYFYCVRSAHGTTPSKLFNQLVWRWVVRSVPGAVATGSQSTLRSRCQDDDPVATALGTDLITAETPSLTVGLLPRLAFILGPSLRSHMRKHDHVANRLLIG